MVVVDHWNATNEELAHASFGIIADCGIASLAIALAKAFLVYWLVGINGR